MTDQKVGAEKVAGDQVAGDKTVEQPAQPATPGGGRPGQAVQQPETTGAPSPDGD